MFYKFFFLLLFSALQIYAQDKNKIVVDQESGDSILIGLCTPEVFADSGFSTWFNSAYNLYQPDLSVLHPYVDELLNLYFVVVMGTWCEDSRFLIPQFMKIIDEIGYPRDKLCLIAVDREKKTPNDDTDNLNIEFVPTIIIYKDGVEAGRVIEYPFESYEKDIVRILEVSAVESE